MFSVGRAQDSRFGRRVRSEGGRGSSLERQPSERMCIGGPQEEASARSRRKKKNRKEKRNGLPPRLSPPANGWLAQSLFLQVCLWRILNRSRSHFPSPASLMCMCVCVCVRRRRWWFLNFFFRYPSVRLRRKVC